MKNLPFMSMSLSNNMNLSACVLYIYCEPNLECNEAMIVLSMFPNIVIFFIWTMCRRIYMYYHIRENHDQIISLVIPNK